MLKSLIVFFIGVLLCDAEIVRYDNYTLYRIEPKGDQIKVLQNLRNTDFRYDFWTEPMSSKEFVNILSSPEYKRDLEGLLNVNEIKFEIIMSNLQEEVSKQKRPTYTRGDLRSMTWDSYHTNDQINAWLDDLIANYPEVSSLVIGNSYEGRPIRGVKISHGGEGKRAIFFEGGLHAREWISPAVVCFMLNELLMSEDEAIKAAAREYDWYIFPVTNPDGYVWTHESNRMWRKNRRPTFDGHIGVDLNRNWNNNWMVVGASTNPSTDNYAGPGPFSEPETFHLSSFIRSVGSSLDIYLTFHSYGQMLLIPFGNTTEPLANYDETLNIGRRAMGALSVKYGTQYVTGNSAEVIYLATGAADDWVKEAIKVPITYCYELRPSSRSFFGFVLPEDQILPSGRETMDSVLELIHQGRRFGVIPTPRSSGAAGLRISAFMVLFTLIARM